jgi:hypothetical protein
MIQSLDDPFAIFPRADQISITITASRLPIRHLSFQSFDLLKPGQNEPERRRLGMFGTAGTGFCVDLRLPKAPQLLRGDFDCLRIFGWRRNRLLSRENTTRENGILPLNYSRILRLPLLTSFFRSYDLKPLSIQSILSIKHPPFGVKNGQ